MNTHAARVFDLASVRDARRIRQHISLTDAQTRIERCSQWLAENGVCVLAFTGTTLHDPIIVAAAHPKVWMLFSGRAERTGYRQDAALRYETWEGSDQINQVRVRWQEVVACA